MKLKVSVAAMGLALLTAGCATSAGAPASTTQASAEPTQQAEGTSSTGGLPAGIGTPPEGKGQIVFFRPSRFVGAALSFTVRENDVDLGKLPNARYFVHVADPGIHSYTIGRNDTIRLEIEPGATLYAIQSTQMGVVAGRAVLSPSDQAAFSKALPDMKPSAPLKPAK